MAFLSITKISKNGKGRLVRIADVIGVFYFKCSPNTMMSRSNKKRSTSSSTNYPEEHKDIISIRINLFQKETRPLVEDLQCKVPIIEFDAEQENDELFQDIKEHFDSCGRLMV